MLLRAPSMPACGQGVGRSPAKQSRRSFAPSLAERAPTWSPSAATGEWRQRRERRRRRGAAAVAAASSPAAPPQQQQQQHPQNPTSSPPTMHPAESESLRLLEWPALCRQVARLCGSSLGAERALSPGALPLGRSRDESALLLQQTAEALLAGGADKDGEDGSSLGGQGKKGLKNNSSKKQQRKSGGVGGGGAGDDPRGAARGLRVRGVLDLRPVLDACERDGLCLTARQLEGVAATLEAAYAAKAQAEEEEEQDDGNKNGSADGSPGRRPRFPALAALAARIDPTERRALLEPIRAAISLGAVADTASPELAAVRLERRDNMAKTRALVADAAKKLFASGASEVKEPVVARGRLAVSVRAGQSGAVPGGAAVRLGQSSTGATLYVEPRGAVAGNNREAELAQREADEELKVLRRLSLAVAARARALRALLSACAELDLVAARAAHARWCGGVRPEFVVETGGDDPEDASPAPINVRALRHPLLLEPSLAALPPPPAAEDDALFAAAADAAAAAAAAMVAAGASGPASPAISVSPQGVPSWGLGLPGVPGAITKGGGSKSGGEDDSDSDGGGGGDAKRAPRAPPPKPIDFVVPPGAKVVAITGPNTGGKTATLKAAGLAVLMAKAGMFLPLAAEGEAGEDEEEGRRPTTAATAPSPPPTPPRLLWFDRVLADIGDAQSLQQSLSTFGGHVKRLKGVLAAATSGSLVLLDEVGSGTDPQEGAALARAVLDRLASSARLTVGTTHHAELRAAADEDPRYTQAAMGFDASTLKPTYTLLWGRTGASCALDVAESLGFDGLVVREARRLAAAAEREEEGARTLVGFGLKGKEEVGFGGVGGDGAATATAAKATTMAGVAAGVEAEIAAAERQLRARRAEREAREAEVSRLRALTAELMRVRRTLQGESDALLRREAAGMALRLHDRLKAARRAPVGGSRAAGGAGAAPAAGGAEPKEQPAELRELEREFARWESLVRGRVEAEYGPGGFVGRIDREEEDEDEGGEGGEGGGGGATAGASASSPASKKPTAKSSSSDPPIRVGDYVHVTRLGSLGYGRVTRVSRAGGGKKGGGGGGGGGVQLRVRTALMGMEARARLDEVLRLPGPPTAGSAAEAEAALAAALAAAEEEERARRQQEAAGGGEGESDDDDAPGAGAEAVGELPGMGAGEAALLMRVDDALSSSSGSAASLAAGAGAATASAAPLPPPAPMGPGNTADVSSEPSAELAAGAALDALDEAAAAAAAAASESSSAPICLYVRVGRDRAVRAAVRAAIQAAADEEEEEGDEGSGGWRLAAPLADAGGDDSKDLAILVLFYPTFAKQA